MSSAPRLPSLAVVFAGLTLGGSRPVATAAGALSNVLDAIDGMPMRRAERARDASDR